jgi:hypothetical protein
MKKTNHVVELKKHAKQKKKETTMVNQEKSITSRKSQKKEAKEIYVVFYINKEKIRSNGKKVNHCFDD